MNTTPRAQEETKVAQAATYQASVDESTCIGSGSCARLARGAFVMDDARGIAMVADIAGADERRLIAADRACPTGAIHLERIQEPHS